MLIAPAPVIIIFSILDIVRLLSIMIFPRAPVADVIASKAFVLTVLITTPFSTATAFVVVLPISIPIIIFYFLSFSGIQAIILRGEPLPPFIFIGAATT